MSSKKWFALFVATVVVLGEVLVVYGIDIIP